MAKVIDRCFEATGHTTFICDFSPPRTGDPGQFTQPDIDADFISVAYNPGRAVRVNSAMLASEINQRTGKDVMFTLAYSAGAAWNETHFNHERFNQLLIEARAELDEKRRAVLYFEMQKILRDEGGTIVPFFTNFVYAHRSNVKHEEKLTGNWPLDGSRAAERWWFA